MRYKPVPRRRRECTFGTSHSPQRAPTRERYTPAQNCPFRGPANVACVLRLGSVVLGADDVERAATFWATVFGYETFSFPESDDDFTILLPPDRIGTRIAVHRSITPVQERPRVHLDLVVDNSTEQSSEIERLLELGATRVLWDYPVDPDFVVLADTEGNRFCIVDASHG